MCSGTVSNLLPPILLLLVIVNSYVTRRMLQILQMFFFFLNVMSILCNDIDQCYVNNRFLSYAIYQTAKRNENEK